MMEEISIREFEEKDIDGLCLLYDELLGKGNDPAKMRTGFDAVDKDPDNHIIVACTGDEIVGTLQYTLIHSLACGNRPHVAVEYVIVSGRHRRKGIARRMFRYLFDDVKAADPVSIFLVSGAERKEAHIMYKNVGFDDEVMGFRKSYP